MNDESRESFYTVNESILQTNTVPVGTMTFRQIEYSEWKCTMFGSMHVRPLKGGEPNWFWRWTQHLILGHKWIKELDDTTRGANGFGSTGVN